MKTYAALPIMNEPNAEKTIRQVLAQTQPPTALYVCVNQPEIYKTEPEKKHVFEQNQKTIAEIREKFSCHIIDKSTIGWDSKNHGVGWARKILMDTINEVANPEDIIISLDADTEYPPEYFESVKHVFERPRWGVLHTPIISGRMQYAPTVALSNPYYHKLIGQEAEDRAILRYEIYMRCYHQNLIRIRSPYAFTALGSAMAVRIEAYRKIGGMAPKKSGEDFYFLQQLCKIGTVSTQNSVTVYPATRLSDRVFFGTGPALIKGVGGDWNSYPIYSPKLWDEIAEIYRNFETYFSPEDYQKLKSNSKTEYQLQKFCHEKFDGLRILQYLKSKHAEHPQPDELSLKENLEIFDIPITFPANFSLETAKIGLLDEIRNGLFKQKNEM
ncbi:MAG: hypothetical protein LBP96_04250 [Bacteroidales bacterium]|jgi:hypothetical protein|nr:hypothetical protein [Bacteroidales bacterium]